jgi:hypothetical protein
MTITCSGDINCGELSQGCTAMCGEAPIAITGSGGPESGAGSDKSKAESYCFYLSRIADTNAQQVSTMVKKGGDLTKMQQYVAAAKAASDRAQAIAAVLPNDGAVQRSASLAKKFSDLAGKMAADEIKRRETMEAIIKSF